MTASGKKSIFRSGGLWDKMIWEKLCWKKISSLWSIAAQAPHSLVPTERYDLNHRICISLYIDMKALMVSWKHVMHIKLLASLFYQLGHKVDILNDALKLAAFWRLSTLFNIPAVSQECETWWISTNCVIIKGIQPWNIIWGLYQSSENLNDPVLVGLGIFAKMEYHTVFSLYTSETYFFVNKVPCIIEWK